MQSLEVLSIIRNDGGRDELGSSFRWSSAYYIAMSQRRRCGGDGAAGASPVKPSKLLRMAHCGMGRGLGLCIAAIKRRVFTYLFPPPETSPHRFGPSRRSSLLRVFNFLRDYGAISVSEDSAT